MTIPIAKKIKAKKLFIMEEKSIVEVSQLTGISGRTMANWSRNEGWVKNRKEYRQIQERIGFDLLSFYESLIKKASESLNQIKEILEKGKITEKKKGRML